MLTIRRKVNGITDDSLLCTFVNTILEIGYSALTIDEPFQPIGFNEFLIAIKRIP